MSEAAMAQTTENAPNSTLTSTDGGSSSPSLTDGGQGAAPVTEAAPGVVFPDNWKEGLSAEFKDDPSMQTILDIPNLAKAYIHAKKQVGADKLVIPGKHGTDADWNEAYYKLGLPQTLDGYEISIPEELGFDDEISGDFKKMAHTARILPDQMNKVLAWHKDATVRANESATKAAEVQLNKDVDGLRQEWGLKFDANVETARQGVKFFNDPGLEQWLDESGNGNKPLFIKMFSKVGALLKEDSLQGGGEGTNQLQTPSDAQKTVNDILSNAKHPYNDKMHPNHKPALDEVAALFKMIHPEG